MNNIINNIKTFSTNTFEKIKNFYSSHKKTSYFILIIFILLCYWIYKSFFVPAIPDQYITTKVEKGSIITSVSGTGQV
jgi:hypothetical protein